MSPTQESDDGQERGELEPGQPQELTRHLLVEHVDPLIDTIEPLIHTIEPLVDAVDAPVETVNRVVGVHGRFAGVLVPGFSCEVRGSWRARELSALDREH